MLELLQNPFFVRNLVYGLEDSLISTTGVIVGITFAGLQTAQIITVGIVLIFVEACSMAFGAFLAEESFLKSSKSAYQMLEVAFYALTMFVAYVFAGVLVILPYVLGLKQDYAYTIAIALAALFTLILFVEKNIGKAILLSVIGAGILALTIFVGRFIEGQQKAPVPMPVSSESHTFVDA